MEPKNFDELLAALLKVVPGGVAEDDGFGGIVFHTNLKEVDGGLTPVDYDYGYDDWDGVSNPGEDSVHYDDWVANGEREVEEMALHGIEDRSDFSGADWDGTGESEHGLLRGDQ